MTAHSRLVVCSRHILRIAGGVWICPARAASQVVKR
jgi:hypothetical protein